MTRDSFSELVKVLMGMTPEKQRQHDLLNLNRDQMKVKARGEMLKFMRGLHTLAHWYIDQHEDGATINMLLEHCFERDKLYKKLNWCFYTWDAESRLWRVMRNRKHARRLRHSED